MDVIAGVAPEPTERSALADLRALVQRKRLRLSIHLLGRRLFLRRVVLRRGLCRVSDHEI